MAKKAAKSDKGYFALLTGNRASKNLSRNPEMFSFGGAVYVSVIPKSRSVLKYNAKEVQQFCDDSESFLSWMPV